MERAAKLSVQLCAGGKAGAAGKKPLGDRHAHAVGLAASELFSVRGKVALVTGGSKGIGLMMSSGLVSNGCKVYVCSRKAELCEAAAAELNAAAARLGSGGSAVPLPGDLSTLAGVVAVADALAAAEPALHILVNNAGATWGAPLEEYPDEAWQKVFDLNVRHLFNITQKVLPLLKRGGVHGDPARVVNIASIDGIRATQTSGPTAAFAYTTSKGAVVHLTRALSRALGEFNITVNCIAPGVFPSEMTRFLVSSEAGEEMVAKANPLNRVGRTADIAGTALYLCSPAGAFTNGAVIALDGGQYLQSDVFGRREE